MTWWVETFLNCTQVGYSLWVNSQTNFADHLFLSWSYNPPTRTPIYRIVRGVLVFCGYRYTWYAPYIVEQNTPGDTTVHQFHLTGLQAPSTIWFYLWAPGGPYGLDIQSPLHHYDLLPVLGPPPVLQWLFPTDLQGWTPFQGQISWVNLGFPSPGCLGLQSPSWNWGQSPLFDSTGALSITCSLYRKLEYTGSSYFQIWVWKSTSWFPIFTVFQRFPNWVFTSVDIPILYAGPNTRIGVRTGAVYRILVDTVTVSMTF